MNDRSSRSHCMLSVVVESKSKLTGQVLLGRLHNIDLAGSERLAKSGAEGQRAKEAAAINKSLSALGNVIAALVRSPAQQKVFLAYQRTIMLIAHISIHDRSLFHRQTNAHTFHTAILC